MTPEFLRHGALAAALAVLALSGPAAAQTTETAPTAGAPADSAGDPSGLDVSADDVLATVGGQPVTLGEIIALRRELPGQYQQLPDEILSRGLLDQVIDQTLLAQAASAAKLEERIDVSLILRNQVRAILADIWLREELMRRIDEDALRRVYDEQYANAEPVEEVRASHILVESEELAKEIRAKLDEGADFAALAAEHGTDGTASRGGDLGYFVKDDMVPQFSEAAFALQPGETAGPVQSPFGWHLIRVTDRRPRPVPPFEEVATQIAQELQQATQLAIVEELRNATSVEVTEPPVPASAIRADELIEPTTE